VLSGKKILEVHDDIIVSTTCEEDYYGDNPKYSRFERLSFGFTEIALSFLH
jgi:hypothetical protein